MLSFEIIIIIILSIATTASFTLGPDTSAVSVGQYEAVKYIWLQEKDAGKHCILGETHPLLALEAVSQKEIIGGGFPIDQFFGQPERVGLLKQMNKNINQNLLQEVSRLTGANQCWFIGDKEEFARQNILAGAKFFDNTAIIKYFINKP